MRQIGPACRYQRHISARDTWERSVSCYPTAHTDFGLGNTHPPKWDRSRGRVDGSARDLTQGW